MDLTQDDDGWHGLLTLPLTERAPELLNLTEGTLRIAGRAGQFVRPDTSDWTRSPEGMLCFRIAGNGDAPF
ncbi:hypothetical protein JBE27_16340 [Streptomyces albiflaviniger]|nr:hypothetical protein [Streptomyces albiflaviniger]